MLRHFSHVWFFATPWTAAQQAPLSMGCSKQECWSGLPFPPSGDLLDPITEFTSLTSPAPAGRFFITRVTWVFLREKCSVLHPKVHALTTWPPPSPGTLDPGPPGTCLPPRASAPEAATPEALSLGSRALRKESTRSQHRLWLLCASNCPGVGWQDIGIGLSSTNQFEAE